ncbi:DUF885 domain-containing protein [Cellulomonas sp. PhB143]|uniref:DUF885 domain-containing protein n=1 Tax=Cellulomonas sp. PhB143 TaxID=2485186 RepID=UPI000F49F944|nr:DUF885 domain-containing protein [Cellulomonas sp. PhB143]ROS76972.1 uncharacterized protein (DUF885 family) [Cellulomonas sp. PhB143]
MSTEAAPRTPSPRTPSAVDAIAEAYVARLAELDPVSATFMGLSGHDHRMTDLSPAGHAARADLDRSTLDALDALEAAGGADELDAVDRVTVAAMRERLGLQLETYADDEPLASLNVIESPLQALRDVFDLVPTGTVEAWEDVAARLEALPAALAGYRESLRAAAGRGHVAAVRQVRACAAQARGLAGEESFFTAFVRGGAAAAVLDGSGACQLLQGRLETGAAGARAAYGELADFLADELAPLAPAGDGVGRRRYALASRYFLGAQVDLDETYAWGLAELARIVAEQEAVAREVAGPDATLADAVAVLDADPARRLEGTDALRAWMQKTSDAAIEALDGVHFDVPGPVRTLECRIAPTQTGGIYYTPPSDDFSRPGRMWWSVPAGVESFTTWMERTTVYHEGVPGHHLQCGQAVFARDTLNSWRRLACWVSGHGEGWALYAERLMADLGFLDDPGDRLGMLDAQRLRAARVVVDLGVHLGLDAPPEWGGGTWDADKAWDFLRANVTLDDATLRFELDRYLGWPGQAPSYKVGQRLWEQVRDAARDAARARGEELDLRAFHARALGLGSVGLDVLREELAR